MELAPADFGGVVHLPARRPAGRTRRGSVTSSGICARPGWSHPPRRTAGCTGGAARPRSDEVDRAAAFVGPPRRRVAGLRLPGGQVSAPAAPAPYSGGRMLAAGIRALDPNAMAGEDRKHGARSDASAAAEFESGGIAAGVAGTLSCARIAESMHDLCEQAGSARSCGWWRGWRPTADPAKQGDLLLLAGLTRVLCCVVRGKRFRCGGVFRTGSGRVVRGQRAFAEALSRCGARRVASSFMCLSQEVRNRSVGQRWPRPR